MKQIRERVLGQTPKVLNDAELLSTLIDLRTSDKLAICRKVLMDCGGWIGMQNMTAQAIHKTTGISQNNAVRVKSAIEIGRRIAVSKQGDRATIHSPEDGADLLMYEMAALEQEELRVILLNTRNHVLGIRTIYRGSTNSAHIRVGEIFRPAIRENAAAIIIVHNHPSGDPDPSPDDVAITRQFIEAGKQLDIDVLDHLIIGKGRFVSLSRKRLAFQ